MTGSDPVDIEPARPVDVEDVARLHAECIREGFLSSLGPGFLSILYRSMVHSPDATLLVARRERTAVGFIAGAAQPGAFYRGFLRGNGVRAAVNVTRVAFRPGVARRLLETTRHVRSSDGPSAELFAIAVEPGSRRLGAGTMLVRSLEEELMTAGAVDIAVVVAAGNADARALYERLGYVDPEPLEVHRGEPSVRYRKTLTRHSNG